MAENRRKPGHIGVSLARDLFIFRWDPEFVISADNPKEEVTKSTGLLGYCKLMQECINLRCAEHAERFKLQSFSEVIAVPISHVTYDCGEIAFTVRSC